MHASSRFPEVLLPSEESQREMKLRLGINSMSKRSFNSRQERGQSDCRTVREHQLNYTDYLRPATATAQ